MRWILFYVVCIRDLYNSGYDMGYENVKMYMWGFVELILFNLVM